MDPPSNTDLDLKCVCLSEATAGRKERKEAAITHKHSDQIGRILKVLGNNFCNKSTQKG